MSVKKQKITLNPKREKIPDEILITDELFRLSRIILVWGHPTGSCAVFASHVHFVKLNGNPNEQDKMVHF